VAQLVNLDIARLAWAIVAYFFTIVVSTIQEFSTDFFA
jgi:hypothetical protein